MSDPMLNPNQYYLGLHDVQDRWSRRRQWQTDNLDFFTPAIFVQMCFLGPARNVDNQAVQIG